jgi:hypothetical protein
MSTRSSKSSKTNSSITLKKPRRLLTQSCIPELKPSDFIEETYLPSWKYLINKYHTEQHITELQQMTQEQWDMLDTEECFGYMALNDSLDNKEHSNYLSHITIDKIIRDDYEIVLNRGGEVRSKTLGTDFIPSSKLFEIQLVKDCQVPRYVELSRRYLEQECPLNLDNVTQREWDNLYSPDDQLGALLYNDEHHSETWDLMNLIRINPGTQGAFQSLLIEGGKNPAESYSLQRYDALSKQLVVSTGLRRSRSADSDRQPRNTSRLSRPSKLAASTSTTNELITFP